MKKIVKLTVLMMLFLLSMGLIISCEKKCSHIGGVATCTERAICELCEQPYGDYLDHNYVNRNCTECGAVNPNAATNITITFESNGGSKIDPISFPYGQKASAPTAPILEGKYLAGWYTDNVTFKNKYTFTTYPAKNLTLYAKWVNETPINSFTVTKTNDSAIITAFKGNQTEVYIPRQVDGLPVTSFGTIFKDNRNITSVAYPETVTTLASESFSGCTYLSSVTLNEGLTNIPSSAFYNCLRLISVNFPESLTVIGRDAFYSCLNLADIDLPSNLMSIGEAAFRGCNKFTSITIPETVNNIGANAFEGCNKLKSIVVPEAVTKINNSAFGGCHSLVSVTLGSEVESIGSGAFASNLALKNITLPETLKTIGDSAFYNCKVLDDIEIPAGVTSMGTGVFKNSSALKEIKVHEDNTKYYTHQGALLSVDNKSVMGYPIGRTETEFEIPDGVKKIENEAFFECSTIKTVKMPDTMLEIGNGAFKSCPNLEQVDFGNSLKIIGEEAFAYCVALKTTDFPPTIEAIKTQAFANCSSIENIVLPATLVTLENYAFNSCISLKTATIENGITSMGISVFGNCPSLKEAKIPTTLKTLSNFTFFRCTSLESVAMHNTITSIGDNVFEDCTSLKSITIPASINNIGKNAFIGCTSLTIYANSESEKPGWNTAITTDELTQVTTNENWNISERPIVWGCTMAADAGYSYVSSFTMKVGAILNQTKALSAPFRQGYNFNYWSGNSTTYNMTTIKNASGLMTASWTSK